MRPSSRLSLLAATLALASGAHLPTPPCPDAAGNFTDSRGRQYHRDPRTGQIRRLRA